MADKNKKKLMELLKEPGNDECADCGDSLGVQENGESAGTTGSSASRRTDWASYNLGIFLCVNCASIHRMLGAHISKVKCIQLDQWNDDQVEFMAATGNLKAKEQYEQYVPVFYKRPTTGEPQVLREQWIRAKYERHEFMDVDRQTYTSGHKTGYLWKRGKEDSRFQSRLFVLSEEENVLKYYNKQDAREPKAAIAVSELNAVFVPEKIGNPNGMQLCYLKDGQTRNIYLYTDDGKDIVEWYNAIRCANYNRLKVAYPGASDDELTAQLTKDFVMEGWLYKTGPKGNEAFKKRWFTLDDRRLSYCSDPLDPHPKGEVFLKNKGDNFAVREGVPPGRHDQDYAFTLRTPDRDYIMSADTKEDRKRWMEALNRAIEKPLYPQESKKAKQITK
ncbi:arf-GAP with dual PH domain-containing protein 1-like isoform X2 [Amphiura filiformis]|uniref:arf-GAP with dual PH domain-containing protein 1-like isoform X2 n=1 Tax=Amphiura filiformis TaxID=82378 RepID=UPI003B21033B